MKGLLSLLIALAALGYGYALLQAHYGAVPCGPMFDLAQEPGARWSRDDVGRPQAIADGLRARQRPFAPPCDPATRQP
jgi:hypothetical protein